MKYLLFPAVAACAVWAQSHAVHAPVAAAPIGVTHISQGMLATLEKNFDARLVTLNPADPVDMLGGTRGLYVQGFGTVFTMELSLVVSPGIMPMRPTYTPELRAAVRKRKLEQLPKLEQLVKDMVKVSAFTLTPMPDDQKVIFAVRLRYLPEEDTSGLPAQVVMSADKKAAQLGDIKTEIE